MELELGGEIQLYKHKNVLKFYSIFIRLIAENYLSSTIIQLKNCFMNINPVLIIYIIAVVVRALGVRNKHWPVAGYK